MTTAELKAKLDELLKLPAETECVEFKAARRGYDFDEIGKYFAALCNEANLKTQSAGWLVFGVQDKPRNVLGTQYRMDRAHLDKLKHEVAQHTTSRITFKEIHELQHPEGRVLMFEIPPAPRGIPIAWKGHYYGRDGDALVALNLQEIEQIRSQTGPQYLESRPEVPTTQIANAKIKIEPITLGVLVCVLGIILIKYLPTHRNAQVPEITNALSWHPPELPVGCTNVVKWFGASPVSVTRRVAEMAAQTNGASFLRKDWPNITNEMGSNNTFVLTNDFTPRDWHIIAKMSGVSLKIGNQIVDDPIMPFILSNRLFIDAKIPFDNKYHKIVMSHDTESEFNIPSTWDVNFNSDSYEIVTGQTNPVFQAFYTSPNEIHLNAIYILNATNIFAAWNFNPSIFTLFHTNHAEPTAALKNSIFYLDTNTSYDLPLFSRKTIFKYPSWKYPSTLNK
jgi:hypothetical protein